MIYVMRSEVFLEYEEQMSSKDNAYQVYNWNSAYVTEAESCDYIWPPLDIRKEITKEEGDFDTKYWEFLQNNHEAFMQMIMMLWNVYVAKDVVILVSNDADMETYTMQILESYLKLIQSRYGITSVWCMFKEDLESVSHRNDDMYTFSRTGLFYWQQDKEAVTNMVKSEYNQNTAFRKRWNALIEDSLGKI